MNGKNKERIFGQGKKVCNTLMYRMLVILLEMLQFFPHALKTFSSCLCTIAH